MYKSNSKKIECAVFAKPFSKAGNTSALKFDLRTQLSSTMYLLAL